MSFLGNLFGSSKTPQVQFTPSGFSNPTGFSVSGGGNVTQSPTLQSNIGNLQSTFQSAAGAFGNLASTVQPGFSQFRQAGLADITNAFKSNVSNLKQNLAQRGVAGSSFGNAALSNAYADYGKSQADFEAQSYLQELQASYQLTQAQYESQAQSYSTAINQSNIQAQTAAQLTAQNNQISANIATANAQLQAQSQAAAGKGLGTILGAGAALALAPFTGGASLMALPGVLAGTGGGGGGGFSGGSGLHMDSGGFYFGA